MKILIKFILLSFVLLHSSVSYAASGKQLLVPIFGDITVFVPIISAPASVNANVTSSAVGEEMYDISWSAVSAAAYYQLIVTNESGEKSYFETSLLNYRLSGVPLGNNRVEILACNSKNQCGASSLVGNFNSRLKVTYSHTDVLGSPIVETGQSGKVVNEYHYKPFGDTKENKKEAIGYTGHLEDPDIQLTYMQARYYDPVLGRFYGNDPVAYRDTHSFNRYAYANNNPYKYVDPDGELPILIPLLAIFGTGSALTYSDYANAPGPNDKIYAKDPLDKALGTMGVPALRTATLVTVNTNSTVVKNTSKVLCFQAGTFVDTPKGKVKIENVIIGDIVWSYNFQKNERIERKVISVNRGSTKFWLKIRISSDDEIVATRFHKFWVQSEEKWIDAIDLKIGMSLKLSNGGAVTIQSVAVEKLEDFEVTYNFEVESDHNYYVGQQGVLVHNGHPEILGTELANKSAHESAQIIQREQAKKAKSAIGEKTGITRIDIPEGDTTKPGNYPHAHGVDKKGRPWSINIDGSLHDAEKSTGTISEAAKDALKKAGWGC